jgi:hypothetical protein
MSQPRFLVAFSSVLAGKCWDSTSVKPHLRLSEPFPIVPSPVILPFEAIQFLYCRRLEIFIYS